MRRSCRQRTGQPWAGHKSAIAALCLDESCRGQCPARPIADPSNRLGFQTARNAAANHGRIRQLAQGSGPRRSRRVGALCPAVRCAYRLDRNRPAAGLCHTRPQFADQRPFRNRSGGTAWHMHAGLVPRIGRRIPRLDPQVQPVGRGSVRNPGITLSLRMPPAPTSGHPTGLFPPTGRCGPV